MASLEDAISSGDPEVIKKRRSTIQRLMTMLQKRLATMLTKSAGKSDHAQIDRRQVLDEKQSLKELQGSFKSIHEAYLHNMEVGEDDDEEELVEKQEQHYAEVMDKIYLLTMRRVTRFTRLLSLTLILPRKRQMRKLQR